MSASAVCWAMGDPGKTQEQLVQELEDLRDREKRYRAVLELASDLAYAFRVEPDGSLVRVWTSGRLRRITGYTSEELAAHGGWSSVIHPDDRLATQQHMEALQSGQAHEYELRVVTQSGQVRWLHERGYPERDEATGRVVRIYGAAQEITERKRAEAERDAALEELRRTQAGLEQRVVERTAALSEVNLLLRREIAEREKAQEALGRANRRLRMLILCGQAVMRAAEEVDLLDQICQLVVEEGGYRLAWVGYAEQDEEKTVRPVAQAGYEEGYLDTLDITWADSARGRGPTGTAIRTGKPWSARHIQSDPRFAPWRAEAIKRGYASSLALPLKVGGVPFGSLNIYSPEPDAFDAEETELLTRLAEDLAFGIGALRTRVERQRAEDALEQRIEDLSSVQKMGRRVSASLALDQVVEAALEEVVSILTPDLALLFLRRGERLELKGVLPADGRFTHAETPIHYVGECLCGMAVGEGRALYSKDVHGDPRCTWEECKQSGLRSLAALPLRSGDHILGVLALASATGADFEERAAFLETVADQIAVALENARLAREASELQILREVDRLRAELVANVSHEIRTPLGLVEVFCTSLLMEDVELDRETQRQFLNGIREETDRLKTIVDNLLGLSQLESGVMPLQRQPVDLGLLAADLVRTFEPQSAEHSFVLQFPSEPLETLAEARQIEQVLRNLLTNALRYSPEGGMITVAGRQQGSEAVICVTDEGIGIPVEDLERVFERFYRVESALTRGVGGVGLGLAVCRGIVEAHGGRIWVESAPGEGSRFCFTLPIQDPAGLPTEDPDQHPTGLKDP